MWCVKGLVLIESSICFIVSASVVLILSSVKDALYVTGYLRRFILKNFYAQLIV